MLHKRCCFASCQSTKKNNNNKFFKVLVSLFMLTEKIVNWHAKNFRFLKNNILHLPSEVGKVKLKCLIGVDRAIFYYSRNMLYDSMRTASSNSLSRIIICFHSALLCKFLPLQLSRYLFVAYIHLCFLDK